MSEDIVPERFRQKIKEAREKQLEILDLSHSSGNPILNFLINLVSDRAKPLTKIPEEVFELKQIKVLNLSENKIKELPESIGNLSNIFWLDLSNNQLTDLPESIIGNFSNLTGINLLNHQLTNLLKSIGIFSNLTHINLRYNQLRNLANSISFFKYLSDDMVDFYGIIST